VSAQNRGSADAATGTDETSFVLRDAPAGSETPERPPAVFGLWDFVRMVLVLAFVVGLIYGAFHLLKKISAPREGGLRFLQVLETRNLAAGRNLHLVEVGNQVLLVGSAEGGVRLVAEITDRETIDAIKLKASEAAAAPKAGNFADLLKGFLHRGDGETAPGESLDFIKRQRDRLKKLP